MPTGGEAARAVVLTSPEGIEVLTRAQRQRRVRQELSGLDLVGNLLAERRRAAFAEDVA